MIKLVLQRFGAALVTLLIVCVIVFGAVELLPGDACTAFLGRDAKGRILENCRLERGLGRPALERFGEWAGGMVRGDLGMSYTQFRPVSDVIWDVFPNTLLLMGCGLLIALLFSLIFGIFAALRPYGLFDATSSFISYFGLAMPVFWFGLVLIYLLYARWQIAPPPVGRLDTDVEPPPEVTGLITVDALLALDWTAFTNAVAHLILPTVTLAFVVMSPFIKMARSSMIGVLDSDYVVAARSLVRSERPCEHRFKLRGQAQEIWVSYPECQLPDTFCASPGRESEASVEGYFNERSGVFEAAAVLTYAGKAELRLVADAGQKFVMVPCLDR